MSKRIPNVHANEHYLKVRQAANLIGNTFENIGSMVKNGILDKHLVMDIYGWIVLMQWQALAGLTAIARTATGESNIYENFEYLAALSKRYLAAHPVTYPRNVERLTLEVPPAARAFLGQVGIASANPSHWDGQPLDSRPPISQR